MTPKNSWPVWTLGRDVIELTMIDMGFLPELFNEEDFEEIVRGSRKELIEDNWEWRGSLVEAIDQVRKKRGLHVGKPRINCSDGDYAFQNDGTCHNSGVEIDDNHKCASRQTERI